jgi:Fe-Mn family superoxide dismutase
MNKIAPSRRNLISAVGGVAAVALAPRLTLGQAMGQESVRSATVSADGPFTVAALPYPVSALAPVISADTMMLHHDQHHAAYVSNLNALARDYPQIGRAPPHELLENIGELPDAIRTRVRNNLGGHVNHTMFWTVMKPFRTMTKPGGDAPSGEVAAAIDRDLGGLDAMKRDFDAAGGRVFGSGWVFVTVTREGRLAIETRSNQDSPLLDSKRVLFGNDVWEHAYYLDYRNRRDDYLKAWWNVVNWPAIGGRYAAARAGTLTL